MVDDKIIWNLIAGRIGFYSLSVSNSIGLFEKLAKDSKSLSELSNELGIEDRAAEALSLMLVNLGFLEIKSNRYSLSEVSKKYLLKDSETYFGGMLELSSNNNWSCDDLKNSVLTNRPFVYGGEDVFELHNNNHEKCELFTNAMHSVSMSSAACWPEKIDLSNNKTFLDIGGGSGAHIVGALKQWKNLSAILLDLENIIFSAKKILNKYNLGNKIEFVIDDFWKCEFPRSDIHFYSQIFHDWPEERCMALAKKSYRSLPEGGKIILHEILFDDNKKGPLMASAGNVGMLAWTEGKQYSGNELTMILKSAGFKTVDIIPTCGYWSIVVGVK